MPEQPPTPPSPPPTPATDEVTAAHRDAYRTLHEQECGTPPAPGERALSVARYDAARRVYLERHGVRSHSGVAVWPPTSQTLMKRLGGGSWAEAMSTLGLQAGAGRARGVGTFDAEAYRQVVVEFLAAVADADSDVTSDSFSQFSTWLAARRESGARHPSAAAVRKHFGSWDAARRVAQPRTMP